MVTLQCRDKIIYSFVLSLQLCVSAKRGMSPYRGSALGGGVGAHWSSCSTQHKSTSIYKILDRLENKGLIDKEHNRIVLSISQQAQSFKKLYYTHHTAPFERVLAGKRISLLSSVNQVPKSVEELSRGSGIPKRSVYYFLRYFAKLGIVRKIKNKGNAFNTLLITLFGGIKRVFSPSFRDRKSNESPHRRTIDQRLWK